MLKKNSLRTKIWIYLIIFSVTILSFLWIFQVVFLNNFYELYKIKQLSNAIEKIEDNNYDYLSNSFLEDIAHDNGICIEYISDDLITYVSTIYNKGCIIQNNLKDKNVNQYKIDFINSDLKENKYKITNPRFNNKTLVHAVNLGNNDYIFASISLEPLDATIIILKNQFIYVTLGILFLSFAIAYFISKKISSPIIKINESAKMLASSKYDTIFTANEDIAEINELVNTLNYTREELAKTDELRRELLANVSHDLKTPLTMIKAYAEMVKDITYKDKEKRNNHLSIIIDEANRLNLLVNDILELSSIQAKTIILNKKDFNLINLINNILKRFDILVSSEDYKFIFNYDKEYIINADKKRMEQVIYNLVNNAINYTGKDKLITINVSEIKKNILVEIIDTGKGIDDKDINLIWDKYYKIDKTYSRDHLGTGLGLSIVKNILIAHDFDYGVKSKKNDGTKFYFKIKK